MRAAAQLVRWSRSGPTASLPLSHLPRAALLHCAPIGNDKGVFIYVVPTAEKFSRCTCQKLLTVQWLHDLSSSRQLQPLWQQHGAQLRAY